MFRLHYVTNYRRPTKSLQGMRPVACEDWWSGNKWEIFHTVAVHRAGIRQMVGLSGSKLLLPHVLESIARRRS